MYHCTDNYCSTRGGRRQLRGQWSSGQTFNCFEPLPSGFSFWRSIRPIFLSKELFSHVLWRAQLFVLNLCFSSDHVLWINLDFLDFVSFVSTGWIVKACWHASQLQSQNVDNWTSLILIWIIRCFQSIWGSLYLSILMVLEFVELYLICSWFNLIVSVYSDSNQNMA